jgi:hypothetical protein
MQFDSQLLVIRRKFQASLVQQSQLPGMLTQPSTATLPRSVPDDQVMSIKLAGTKAARELAGLSRPLRIEPGRPAPDSRFVALGDLTLTTCRWPLGDPRDEGFRFCGAPCDPPYCISHRRLAYTHAQIPRSPSSQSNDE